MRISSPCGVWVVSHDSGSLSRPRQVSVPLRGVGCFIVINGKKAELTPVSVPLRGVGCFNSQPTTISYAKSFSPLAGVGCFLVSVCYVCESEGFSPLAGCGLFLAGPMFVSSVKDERFSPLAGCGLFLRAQEIVVLYELVSVPLRGVGCFFVPSR